MGRFQAGTKWSRLWNALKPQVYAAAGVPVIDLKPMLAKMEQGDAAGAQDAAHDALEGMTPEQLALLEAAIQRRKSRAIWTENPGK
jgi:hypothetical protein